MIALASFWIPIAVPKGNPLHRRAGWVYAIAMWIAAASAWVVCTQRLLDDNPRNDSGAWFLAFIGLLAANGAATGIRVLRRKGQPQQKPGLFDLASSGVFLIAAVALAGVGIAKRSPLHGAFGALGVLLAGQQLRYWFSPPRTKMDWWMAHMSNMLAACIGTVTAFALVQVPRFGLEAYALYVWLAPGLFGGLGISLWTRYYRRKFAARATTATSSPR